MNIKNYFKCPVSMPQRQYEALRAHFIEGLSISDVSLRYYLSESYLRKVKSDVQKRLDAGQDPFFLEKSFGPKSSHKADPVRDQVIRLRQNNLSIVDIKSALESLGHKISLDTIHRVLIDAGFKRLERRTYKEKRQIIIPTEFETSRSKTLEICDEKISTGKSGGVLAFLPLIKQLGIIEAIEKAKFPETSEISAVSYILSFLALKLVGNKRVSHDESWGLDRVLGLFAGLNVLPKSASLSSYSYRVSRSCNRTFLVELSKIFDNIDEDSFNLDFKTIPHWGDDSILEKHFASDRGRSVKSVLALIVQSVTGRNIAYTNAEMSRSNQSNAVLEFVDFWKEGHGVNPKMLIFDSKVTIQKNLSKLNQDNVKFITLRQRGPSMLKHAASIPDDQWQYIWVEAAKKKTRDVKIYDEMITLEQYEGEIRQIIFIDHSKEPVFMITNELEMKACDLVRKYGRRWLVEQEISEQIVFFHLNQLSSSIVVKVDFDLTLTVLAHNLYRKLAENLTGFEHCNVETLHRRFIDGRADVAIKDNKIAVVLSKRAHLPILFDAFWMNKSSKLSWMNCDIEFKIGTSS
jgi:hypothetical protein